jgi:TldD protein
MDLRSHKRTRRAFLSEVVQTGSTVALAGILPVNTMWGSRELRIVRKSLGLGDSSLATQADPTHVRELALRAIDAARTAGAVYADVRLTRTITQQFKVTALGRYPSTVDGPLDLGDYDGAPTDYEILGVSVRVLTNGGWGFAASPYWMMEEMPLLAQNAVRQAQANAKATPQHIELAPTPAVTGDWSPPGVQDPFTIPPEEKLEHLRALADYAAQRQQPRHRHREDRIGAGCTFVFTRQEWALATSDGTYCTQRRYIADGEIRLTNVTTTTSDENPGGFQSFATAYPGIVGQGWELCDAATAKSRIDEAIDRFNNPPPETLLPVKPVDVGRYTIVCAASLATQFVGQTIGPATELDRAIGYEANSGGTSWLNDPLNMVGTLKVGAPLLTVTANRSDPKGLATVKWDDEGVEPEEITLVKDGVLNDFLTTRESASWLAPYYAKQGRPVRSHGCAAADHALSFTMLHPPNLVMQPAAERIGFEELVKDTKKGLAILSGRLSMDFQSKNGLCIGDVVHEIENGKLGAKIENVGILFQSSELWKNLTAIGGSHSTESRVAQSKKGQPEQKTLYTVSAVPFAAKDVTVVDVKRRA